MFDHFRLFAPLYDRLVAPPDPGRLLEVLDLPAAGRLLDIGGGTGRVAGQLAPYVDLVVVADEVVAMLRQARAKGLSGPAARAERLPFADESFERVLAVDALHHFARQRQALREMARVLRPGGRLVVEEPDLRRLPVKLIALGEKLMLMRSRFIYPHEISRELTALGLETRVTTDGQLSAWVIAEKGTGSRDVAGRDPSERGSAKPGGQS
jgi:demethylmenaquinone methyltransferase/2-methoxy-6-polyprenyl-1,4-benzoquinol methylase